MSTKKRLEQLESQAGHAFAASLYGLPFDEHRQRVNASTPQLVAALHQAYMEGAPGMVDVMRTLPKSVLKADAQTILDAVETAYRARWG